MKFFIDTADASVIRSLLDTYPIQGVTTNPAIIAKVRKPFAEVVNELRLAVPKSLSIFFQVVGTDATTMVKEADRLSELVGENLIVKVPVSIEGYKTTKILSQRGTPFTATAIHAPLQAILAAEYGARFVAPYVSRMDSIQSDGAELVAQIVTALSKGNYPTEVIAASFRTPHQINQMALAGAHAVTISPDMFGCVASHPLTDSSVAMFSDCWSAQYQGATSLLES